MSLGTIAKPGQIVVIVDPYSTGCVLGQEISKRGYQLLAVWTHNFAESAKCVPLAVGHLDYYAEVEQKYSLVLTGKAVKTAVDGQEIVACIAGGDAGVDLADELSEHLGLLSNGSSAKRRDKKVQQDLVRSSGLRAIRQAGGSTFDQVEAFLKTEAYPIVLKPVESGGSDGVKLCNNFNEAKEHFQKLMKSDMVDGGKCQSVLCQEFLRGKEYVVDHVSLNGVHKTMMVRVYDKRPVNGASFVYFATVPIDPDSTVARMLITYTRNVLDAMGVKNGPTHGEIMMTDDGPCLVEMNCRSHGSSGDWRPLCCALTGGYSQVEATVDAFLDPDVFLQLPDKPPSPFKASGMEVIMVSYNRGVVKTTPGYDIIKKMPSFVCLESGIKAGSKITYSIDLDTAIGNCILMHEDDSVVKRDLAFIRYLEEIDGLFTYETGLENLSKPGGDVLVLQTPAIEGKAVPSHRRVFSVDRPNLVRRMSDARMEFVKPLVKRMTTVDVSNEVVVIVDPYSSGCCVAKEIMSRGYKVIALWTNGFAEDMKLHVPLSCTGMTYYAQVTEAATLEATAAAAQSAAKPRRIVACLAGGEAGVDLGDSLSEKLGVRTNGTAIPNRRDKKVQQELVKAAGMRSVRQAGSGKFAEVEHFLRTEPFPLVLKPTESAGSDGVKLCHNFNEAKEHFDLLMSSQMVNGGGCPAVLCQEFLRGKEYIVDHVSRDGVHKTMMVWVYDKRAVNGAAFVYFGCIPVDSQTLEAQILIKYTRGVLDAIGIKNGASHSEIVMTADGPCLVEVNCRVNGGDGSWRPLCLALTGGYSQIEATVDSILDKKQFYLYNDTPPSPFKAAGQEVNLVSFSRGTVKATPGFDVIAKLPSFVYFETGIKEGSKVEHTVDLFTVRL